MHGYLTSQHTQHPSNCVRINLSLFPVFISLVNDPILCNSGGSLLFKYQPPGIGVLSSRNEGDSQQGPFDTLFLSGAIQIHSYHFSLYFKTAALFLTYTDCLFVLFPLLLPPPFVHGFFFGVLLCFHICVFSVLHIERNGTK